MLINPDYIIARKTLLDAVLPVGTERIDLGCSYGRILAEDICAEENIPPFDRSPYDGYAFRSVDSIGASKEAPVTLRILEEIPAGAAPTVGLSAGTAVKLLTGAPIPKGADAVVMFEKTVFTADNVTIFKEAKHGENVIYAGEDVVKGAVLASRGQIIDSGVAGTLASQGIYMPLVYRVPKIGILSTGNELVEAAEKPGPGKIRNSNRYTLTAAVQSLGCEPVYLGTAGDSVAEISELIKKGIAECDAVISTGGVSVGDYDLTPDAMEKAGAHMLLRGADIKPGMACAYGVINDKVVCALSGNPASSITNFHIITAPALRKLAGQSEYISREIELKLLDGFSKKSPTTRFLRGTLVFDNGCTAMKIPKDQGNVVLSSTIGCNVMAVVPAGSGAIKDGTILKGFLI